MAFTPATFIPLSAQANSDSSRVFVYNTADATATVVTSGYFDPAALTLGLKDDDFVFVTQSNGTDIYQIAVSGAGVATIGLTSAFA